METLTVQTLGPAESHQPTYHLLILLLRNLSHLKFFLKKIESQLKTGKTGQPIGGKFIIGGGI